MVDDRKRSSNTVRVWRRLYELVASVSGLMSYGYVKATLAIAWSELRKPLPAAHDQRDELRVGAD